MIYKRLIVLLGIFLGSHVPAVAQTPAPQIVQAEERVAPAMTMLPTVSTPLPAASLLLSQDSVRSPVHFTFLFAGAYEREQGLESLSPVREVKTLYFTQLTLPLVQLWSGRLQLNAFQNTLHVQNLRSVQLSGLGVSFHFGRDTRMGRPIRPWRDLSRIVGTVLN
jgi:hypothetical protein